MQISELVAVPRLHLRFLSGAEHAHRSISWAYTTDLLEPKRYLSGGELVLTGMMWRRSPEDSAKFADSLIEAGAVCLAVGTALGEVPPDLIEACRQRDLPLIEVPSQTSFGAVTEEVLRLLSRYRFTTIAETRDRHRRLMAEVAAGGDFPDVFAGIGEDAGLHAWIVSSTGRLVASAGQELPEQTRRLLASRMLGWSSFPRATQIPVTENLPSEVTGMPVQTRDSHPLASWFLVCAGDHVSWSDDTHEAVAELVSVAVLARSRVEEHAVSDARHVEELPRLLSAQRFDEVAALLHVSGREEGATGSAYGHVVVSAILLPESRLPDLSRRILGELIAARPDAVVTGVNDALAIVTVPTANDTGVQAAEELRQELAQGAQVLESGLMDYQLALGISSTARGVDDLQGASVEARHARRLAELRGGRSCVIAGAEIDSHELLLASVPHEVQSSYRERLLGPLLAYDRDHRSDLVATLEQFLRHSGSWQRCASAMHVHVNTLRYRIGRVEQLTGRNLSSLEDRVDLFLALKLRG